MHFCVNKQWHARNVRLPAVNVEERVVTSNSQAAGHVAAYLHQRQNPDECHAHETTGESTPSCPPPQSGSSPSAERAPSSCPFSRVEVFEVL
jgi:hypothetical protein